MSVREIGLRSLGYIKSKFIRTTGGPKWIWGAKLVVRGSGTLKVCITWTMNAIYRKLVLLFVSR